MLSFRRSLGFDKDLVTELFVLMLILLEFYCFELCGPYYSTSVVARLVTRSGVIVMSMLTISPWSE